MRPDIVPGANFPDYELSDHTKTRRRLSELQGNDPLVLILSRGHFCPKDHQQHLELAAFYSRINVAYTQIATIATAPAQKTGQHPTLPLWPNGNPEPSKVVGPEIDPSKDSERLVSGKPTTRITKVGDCHVLGRYTIYRGMTARKAAALAAGSSSALWRQTTTWKIKKILKTIGGPAYVRLRRVLLDRRYRRDEGSA